MNTKALNRTHGTKAAYLKPIAVFSTSPAKSARLSLSILLAEDEAAQAARLEKALRLLGHLVACKTRDGQEACQLCQTIRPDLVLMDQTLPKMDGLQAAFVINRNHALPVVLMASRARPGLVEEARKAGVYACLFKPVEQDLLDLSIQSAYQHFKRVRNLQNQAEDLRREIQTRKLMGRASGILMERLGISEKQAVMRIHNEAKAKGVAPMDVAQGLITAEAISKTTS
jgi:response regulator NasT